MRATLVRPLAEADLIERTHYYRRDGGDALGERFFDAAIATLDAIGRMPGAGSPHGGELCGIPGLRVRRVAGFPCGWFYFVAQDHVDVVRLLADAQDLPTITPPPTSSAPRSAASLDLPIAKDAERAHRSTVAVTTADRTDRRFGRVHQPSVGGTR